LFRIESLVVHFRDVDRRIEATRTTAAGEATDEIVEDGIRTALSAKAGTLGAVVTGPTTILLVTGSRDGEPLQPDWPIMSKSSPEFGTAAGTDQSRLPVSPLATVLLLTVPSE
jgi:hypothetical protein